MSNALIVAVGLVMGCSSSPATARSPDSTHASDAGIDAGAKAREACEDRCSRNVMQRHDACGRHAGPPWPEWCADSNERMREDCEATCE